MCKCFSSEIHERKPWLWNLLLENLNDNDLMEFPAWPLGIDGIPNVISLSKGVLTDLAKMHAKFWEHSLLSHPMLKLQPGIHDDIRVRYGKSCICNEPSIT